MKIEDVLARRTDLSTFLVHLTRTHEGESAPDRLEKILRKGVLMPGTPMGHAVNKLRQLGLPLDSQKCVSFTETPLEHIRLMCDEIEGRACRFESYGVAITKKQGRAKGLNPVWYVDITPGHDWLSGPINDLVDEAITRGDFGNSSIAKIAPFIEQMGSGAKAFGEGGYRKEFWWEREWRCSGPVIIQMKAVIVIAPENEFDRFREAVDHQGLIDAKYIDPNWSLEQMIARLAGFPAPEVGPF